LHFSYANKAILKGVNLDLRAGEAQCIFGPNGCGKTTMFNSLTGDNQYVGNWPGVTVEKKEGFLKGNKNVVIQDLPGIYSLSPYSLEEVVSRNYLINEKPDVILNIVDGSNLERNLYLTSQLMELGIPIVIAVNMMDIVRKNGDNIDIPRLSKELGCVIVETSALKSEGSLQAVNEAIKAAGEKPKEDHPHVFTGSVEHSLAHIEDSIKSKVSPEMLRFYAVKMFERDEKVIEEFHLPAETMANVESVIKDCEKEMDDDADSIIVNERYVYIGRIFRLCVSKGKKSGELTTSDKIDNIVTNRVLALPIFALVMFVVYFISVTTVGAVLTDFTNDTLFGQWIIPQSRILL
jgi:ferrous iron transport protein B